MGMIPRIAIIGEPLLELSLATGQALGTARFSYGGDTLNTAIYLARLGIAVDYITALGTDPYSDAIIDAMQREGIATGLIVRHPTRVPGLYAIQTDENGERSFTYWRSDSAARAMFDVDEIERSLEAVKAATCLYVSGITLSIFDANGRARLASLAHEIAGRGEHVAFDPNYRPRAWPSQAVAAEAFDSFLPDNALVMPTLDDERMLRGVDSPGDCASVFQQPGTRRDVIIKIGPDGAIAYPRDAEPVVCKTSAVKATDTTGAGDSFNAAFLATLMRGGGLEAAMTAGNRLAGEVIRHPGAVIPSDAMPEFAPRPS